MIKKLKKGSTQLPEGIWNYLENKANEECLSVAAIFRKYIIAGMISEGVSQEEIRKMIRGNDK